MIEGLEHRLAREQRFLRAPDPDGIFLEDMLELIGQRGPRQIRRPRDGQLRVLLLGYAGAGNTGADIRTIETVRQLHRLFPLRTLDITLFACGDVFDHPMLASLKRFVPSTLYLPDALNAAMSNYDLVLNCEGSTYTSKFSDGLGGLLIGGLALAAAHGAVAVAYGVDAGKMSDKLTRFAKTACADVEIFCRSEGALHQLAALGLPARPGADTAWLYRTTGTPPHALPHSYVALCPNNPYWWPVTTDVRRAIECDNNGTESRLRYGPMSFHTWDDERAVHFFNYKAAYAAIAIGLLKQGITPVLVAMEKMDRAACDEIAALLPFSVQIVSRGADNLDAVVGTIERAQCIVTTRYHAAVLGISNRIPVVGVSMDPRIQQLLGENGLGDWVFSCDEPFFAEYVLDRLSDVRLNSFGDLRETYTRIVTQELRRFARMGTTLVAAVEHASQQA